MPTNKSINRLILTKMLIVYIQEPTGLILPEMFIVHENQPVNLAKNVNTQKNRPLDLYKNVYCTQESTGSSCKKCQYAQI
jgi:hypothetical protein